MCLVINNDEYSKLDDEKVLLGKEYTNEGVVTYKANWKGSSWNDRTVQWGEKEDIKQCPKCKEYHNRHNPPLCFGCAMGLK